MAAQHGEKRAGAEESQGGSKGPRRPDVKDSKATVRNVPKGSTEDRLKSPLWWSNRPLKASGEGPEAEEAALLWGSEKGIRRGLLGTEQDRCWAQMRDCRGPNASN